MEQLYKIVKYWDKSLKEEIFTTGKIKNSELEKNYINNRLHCFKRVNSGTILRSLFGKSKNDSVEVIIVPKLYKKQNSKYKDLNPSVIVPVLIQVKITRNGFIYPTKEPVISRDLLRPLDNDELSLGEMKAYNHYLEKNKAPIFDVEAEDLWEDYFLKKHKNEYQEPLKKRLIEESFVTKDDLDKDIYTLTNKEIKGSHKRKKREELVEQYNNDWDNKIENRLKKDVHFETITKKYIEKWDRFENYVEELIEKIIASEVNKKLQDYYLQDSICLIKSNIDTSFHIRNLYKHILSKKEKNVSLRLFKNITCLEDKEEEKLIESTDFFSKRLGHNSNDFSLTEDQRVALSALLKAKNGEVLAVNGPPGTGKTTMLLAVVASLWIKKAIERSEPPIIVASSTNNQAVTNIIDAFAENFSEGDGSFAGRWIDDIDSFGSYFCSSTKAEYARKKGYLTFGELKSFEKERFYEKAKEQFLVNASKAFGSNNLTVNQVVNKLHKRLKTGQDQLKIIKDYHQEGEALKKIMNIDYLAKGAEKVRKSISVGNLQIKKLEELQQCWDKYLADESLLFSALKFFSFIRKRRVLKARVFARENNFSEFFSIDSMEVDTFKEEINKHSNNLKPKINALEKFHKTQKTFLEKLACLHDNKFSLNIPFQEIDKEADSKIRFELFLLATHYWEGRWLLDMEKLIKNNHLESIGWPYENIQRNNWHRRMKLTPCAVMTSYMLPKFFVCKKKEKGENTRSSYSYDFIDLLIIDEAGQVSPQVAGASFALAKKALVIGDTKQIPPIEKLKRGVDIGNLTNEELLFQQGDYKQLQKNGITAFKGSIMKVAQHRTKYHQIKELERGLYLTEHRRCYDEIIAYCNNLSYKGYLKPMKGKKKGNNDFPAMGYLNIEGKCEEDNGSKKNVLEAKSIAGWIINNYKKLRGSQSDKEIKDVVAVVTPFKAQASIIKMYLKEAKNESLRTEFSKITVGTVHALQGAERPVVIFSPTYSKHNNGAFINKDSSLLNVAVSRAKESFLVFGEMTLFNRKKNNPTGILAKYLFATSENEVIYNLYSETFKRADIGDVTVLTNHKKHDEFLKDTFEKAISRIIIISPWIKYNVLEEKDYMSLMQRHSQKAIIVYTDRHFNTTRQNIKDASKEKEFKSTIKKLEDIGVKVVVCDNVHSKIVIRDENTLCFGSFNWFSASRGGKYTNMEHSMVYSNNSNNDIYGVKKEIEVILNSLN